VRGDGCFGNVRLPAAAAPGRLLAFAQAFINHAA